MSTHTGYYGGSEAINEMVFQFFTAPIEHPEILPSILPIIGGLIVIELYFGKHKQESLGWNTSVGNAVIWVTTGLNLYMTEQMTQPELYATYVLIGLGVFVGYKDFFHQWSSSVAFFISSAGIVYTLTYILVVIVKTDLVPDEPTLKAAAVFFVVANVGFKILQGMETDQDRRSNPMMR